MGKNKKNHVETKGEGPNEGKKPSQMDYHHAAGSWGATFSVGKVVFNAREPISATRAVFKMNHENGGFDCPGCAWPDDRKGLKMDICENGIKHSTWEMTHGRCSADFFQKHTVTELATFSAYELEKQGRLTEPMRYDPKTDKYVPISWDDAFKIIGDSLQSLESPDEATFYTSGRLSNEGSFLYQLLTRELGTNNQPDCSNMCHEATGRALSASIGTGKGTVDLIDWQKADAIFVMGINAASNTPRMLSALVHGVKEHGTKIVHINPLIEAAARRAITPHEIMDMLLLRATKTSTLNVQPRVGGDFALLRGISKALLEKAKKDPLVIDKQFIQNHTADFATYESLCESLDWQTIERQSGLPESKIREMADIYGDAQSCIFAWCLGITQHECGVDTVREIMNVLLLKGNIGREGAGPSPVRGHSNVQGNRTLGINNRPSEKWLLKMDKACGIKSPRAHGYGTVSSIQAMMDGKIKVFVGLGGNFVKATPDPAYTDKAFQKCALTVQISTKLNRSHVIHGKDALILPCLGRTEIDEQATGPQSVTVEDSMAMVHISKGMKKPVSNNIRSEVSIVASMAKASLPQSKTPWDAYVDNYDLIRDKVAEAIDGFEDFNRRVRQPLGFRLKQPARELVFLTDSGKANFSCAPLPDVVPPKDCLRLMTMRSHDQWNTTIYSDNDRYRGVKNIRTLLFMNEKDMKERGIEQMDLIKITSIAKDKSRRQVEGYRAVRYDIPEGCTSGYMPELNVLCAITDYSHQSDQPLFKEIIIEVEQQKNT
jgi:molybdopterin-dependent oxidoreductase alpha subunit